VTLRNPAEAEMGFLLFMQGWSVETVLAQIKRVLRREA